jgi:hypothetical protein
MAATGYELRIERNTEALAAYRLEKIAETARGAPARATGRMIGRLEVENELLHAWVARDAR